MLVLVPGLLSSPPFGSAWVEEARLEAHAPPDAASLSPLFPVAAVALLAGLSPVSSSCSGGGPSGSAGRLAPHGLRERSGERWL